MAIAQISLALSGETATIGNAWFGSLQEVFEGAAILRERRGAGNPWVLDRFHASSRQFAAAFARVRARLRRGRARRPPSRLILCGVIGGYQK
jgi:hypothetical protein